VDVEGFERGVRSLPSLRIQATSATLRQYITRQTMRLPAFEASFILN
jgi:hypothetical protein